MPSINNSPSGNSSYSYESISESAKTNVEQKNSHGNPYYTLTSNNKIKVATNGGEYLWALLARILPRIMGGRIRLDHTSEGFKTHWGNKTVTLKSSNESETNHSPPVIPTENSDATVVTVSRKSLRTSGNVFFRENSSDDDEETTKQVMATNTLEAQSCLSKTVKKMIVSRGQGVIIPGKQDLQEENGASIAHAQGDRPTMESQHLVSTITFTQNGITQTADIFAIFEEHNGDKAAKSAKENLAKHLQHHLEQEKDPFDAFTHAFLRENGIHGHPSTNADITGAVAIKMNNELYVLNLGGSRVLIKSKNKGFIQATKNIEPKEPKYEKNITPRKVNSSPIITHFDLKDLGDSTLVICSNGIVETQSSKDVLDIVEACGRRLTSSLAEDILNDIIDSAYSGGSGGNLSALVVSLKPEQDKSDSG